MAQFLFVEDYIKHVANLKAAYPLDEAMVKAVDGADYHQAGQTERDILFVAGLRPGMSVFDLGCGSGRLATALTKERISLQYLGTASCRIYWTTPPQNSGTFRYILHRELSVPAESSSVDIACAFSVFTHQVNRYIDGWEKVGDSLSVHGHLDEAIVVDSVPDQDEAGYPLPFGDSLFKCEMALSRAKRGSFSFL
jgi:hypothetical protein